jgi:hypothetical protein
MAIVDALLAGRGRTVDRSGRYAFVEVTGT